MKHIFQHPPETGTAKAYWRSVEDFAHTEQFQGWLNREFPQGASEFWGDGVSRRSFLRLMGASMALAGLGLSACRRPEAHIVPFSKTPEWQIPGKTLNYATSMPRRGGGAPLLVTSVGGRPIKVEGNPSHPLSKGKSDTFAQSSILDLYDPDRSHRFAKDGSDATPDEFAKAFTAMKESWAASQGKGLAVLAEDNVSPTEDRLRAELAAKYPGSAWAYYEPAQLSHERSAAELAYGKGAEIRHALDKASVILSLDSDCLGDESTLSGVRGFAAGRRVENADSKMNRLYAVESRYTVTGSMADHRLRLPASRIVAVAAALAREVGAPNLPVFSALPALDVDPAWISEAAKDLLAAGSRGLVVAGAGQPVQVHLAVLAINEALGAKGTTFNVTRQERPASLGLADLASKIRNGEITDLLILGGNPAYNAPVDLDWAGLQKSVKNVIRLGYHEDETSGLGGWHVPQSHYLESWNDAVLQDGSYGCVQPLILPLYAGLSSIQLLGFLLDVPAADGKMFVDGPELVKETFKRRAGASITGIFDFENAWNLFVRDGFLKDSEAKAQNPAFAATGLAAVAETRMASPLPLGKDNLEVVFIPDSKVDDGRYINNGWLQEAPDVMTKLTWDNAALMSAKTAQELGIYSGVEVKGVVAGLTDAGIYHSDVITVTVDGRSLDLPFLVVPGHPDYTITLPLGYGHEKTGRVGQGVGFNAYKLRSSTAPYVMTGATVAKTAKKRHDFAITQEHWSMEGRDIVREAPINYFKENTGFVKALGIESHTPENKSFYKSPAFDYQKYHQWGMVVDLTTCIGCNACTIACQSENNIAIVGKDQVKKGREMHWIRIDRYFAGSQRDIEMGKGVIPSDPEVVLQPVMCMQCENAPCETVCPVNATVHTEEGLNAMAYNRCIGTRYCANNCPYKVRRFNWFDYNQRQLDQLYWGPLGPKGVEETVKMSKNPNVTVRMRGVMEKCTFCVQRIETAKIDHKVSTHREERKIPTDSLQVACQQACPADAIVFGDLSDPESRVNKIKGNKIFGIKGYDHNYNLLDYLNTRPRLSYLAKIRNPNPKMPGAELVGMSLVNSRIHSHGGHDAHGHEENSHPVEKESNGHAH